jgi:DNA-binding MarR family transcriptional regulator
MSDIAREIQQLRDKGLVELLVDEDVHRGRYYGLTDAGEEIADELEERRAERGESPQ